MISEWIFTKRTLEKDPGQPGWPTQKQKSAESDKGLHYLLKIIEQNGNDSINDCLS